MIQIYTGDGKGKTTAATGLCIRAMGAGKKVFFVQFLKNGSSSEILFLKKFAPPEQFSYLTYGDGKFLTGKPSPEMILNAEKTLSALKDALCSGKWDVVIADEILGAMHGDLISREEILSLMDSCCRETELILTGRNVPEEISEHADLVSEIHAKKHYYLQGVPARKGIEF